MAISADGRSGPEPRAERRGAALAPSHGSGRRADAADGRDPPAAGRVFSGWLADLHRRRSAGWRESYLCGFARRGNGRCRDRRRRSGGGARGGARPWPRSSARTRTGGSGSTRRNRAPGPRRAVPGFTASENEQPIGWTGDGRALYVYQRFRLPAAVFRLDVATGARTLWKEIAPPDRAGVESIWSLDVTPDGRAYAYSFGRTLSDLYLAEGLD